MTFWRKNMNLIKQNKATLFVTLLLILLTIAVFLVSIATSVEAESVKVGEIEIAHITDLHYYSFASCYHGDPNSADYKNTEFYSDMQSATQMKHESTSLFAETIQGIIKESPDYLLVSGDITSNGELLGHYDVANALRWMQEKIRANGKPNFQVLVVPGNHDLYNSRASYYADSDCVIDGVSYKSGDEIKIADNITTAEAFAIIYHGLGYPDLTEAELRSTAIGSHMMSYYDNQASAEYAFTTQYHASNNAGNLTISYYKDILGEDWYPNRYDRQQGCLSYFVQADNNYSFACFDTTEREYILEDYEEGKHNTLNNTYSYYEELTGGRIGVAVQQWMKTVAATSIAAKDTTIAVAHHNFVPHYSLEENFTKDFVVYNWQDAASFLTDELGIRYGFTGHMHSTDRAQFISYEGNILQDFETGSVISVGNPSRFTKVSRYLESDTVNEIVESLVVKLKSLEGVKGLKIDDPSANDASLYLFQNILDLNKATREDIFYNIVDRMLGGLLNEKLVDTLNDLVANLDLSSITSLVKPINSIKDLAPILIHEIFYDFDFNIDGVSGDNLADYVMNLLDKEGESLNMVIYQEGGESYTLEQMVLWAYTSHLAGEEGSTYDLNTTRGRAAQKMISMMEDGTLVRQLFSDLLDPLFYADNSILKQLFTHEFNVSSLVYSEDTEKRNNFIALVSLLIPDTDPTHPVNNGGKLTINSLLRSDAKILKIVLSLLKLSSTITDMINEVLNIGVINWAEDFLDKYLTDSFYTGIGGLLAEALMSFSIDEYNDGKIILYKSSGIEESDWVGTAIIPDVEGYDSSYTYNGKALSLELNPPTFKDGRLPSIFTSTFGDDAASSQNFKWYTDYKVGGKLLYRKVGETQWIEATVTTTRQIVEIPLIDLGLFATKTATQYKPVTVTPDSFSVDKKKDIVYTTEEQFFIDRERHNVTSSVKLANVHEVFLTNLEANTEYEFKVYGTYNDDEYCLQDYIEDWEKGKAYSFKTAIKEGESNDFTLLAISDLQGTIESSYELAKKALQASADTFGYDFIINCGDVTDSGSNIKQWSYAQNKLSTILGNTTTVIAAGNHEASSGALAAYYNFGNLGNASSQKTDTGVYYSFNYGKTHFVVLNTNDYKTGLADKQLTWLKEDLQAANENTNITNIVVAMHKGLYSVGSHVSDKEVIAMKKQLTPIFAEYGVDLVLQGHDHVYNTTQVIDANGKVVKDLSNKDNAFTISNNEGGVVYMTLGTISDKYYEYRQVAATEALLNDDYTIYSQINAPMMTNISFNDNGAIVVSTYAYNKDTDSLMTIEEYKKYLDGGFKYWWIVITAACVVVAVGVGLAIYFVQKKKKLTPEQVILQSDTIEDKTSEKEESQNESVELVDKQE